MKRKLWGDGVRVRESWSRGFGRKIALPEVSVGGLFSGRVSPQPVSEQGVNGLDTPNQEDVKPVSEGTGCEGRESRKLWICKDLDLVPESRSGVFGL